MPIDDAHRLLDGAEMLFRQLHPSQADEMGRPSTGAFKPGRSHDFQLSVDRGRKVSAEEATLHWQRMNRATLGAWGVTVRECDEQRSPAYDDEGAQQPAHALIDMQPLSNSDRKKAASNLAAHARERGCLFASSS